MRKILVRVVTSAFVTNINIFVKQSRGQKDGSVHTAYIRVIYSVFFFDKAKKLRRVTLKFGDDGSDEFATLSGMGAFFDATTERIFEESGKGILASM